MDKHIVRQEQESPDENPELAALADGSLPAERRRALEDQVAHSPALGALLAEQQMAMSLVRGLDVTAPASLRAHVNGLTRKRARSWPSALRPRLIAAGALAAAAVAVVLALALPGGAGGPTVVEAAGLARLAPTLPAPPTSQAHADLLTAAESGVPYPDWQRPFAWRATGVRTDSLAGRHVTTVYYARGHSQIAYSIVSGAPLGGASGWQTARRDGVVFHVRHSADTTIVTWQRRGHSCVLSGRGVSAAALQELASWHGEPGTLYR